MAYKPKKGIPRNRREQMSELGASGGNVTAARHGSEYFRELARKRWAKRDAELAAARAGMWQCTNCDTWNAGDAQTCEDCDMPKPSDA